MGSLVPNGYITIADAEDRVGQELFPTEWTGDERTARTGLIGGEEWARTKDLLRPTGSGAGRGPCEIKPLVTGDPADPAYQTEYQAGERRSAAYHRLHTGLEAGLYEAAVLDPWSGALHSLRPAFWRRHSAARMLRRGEAPLPYSPNKGRLYICLPTEETQPPQVPEIRTKSPRNVMTYRTGSAGRPTSKHLVEAEFDRRVRQGDLPSSLSQLAAEMVLWLTKTHPSAASMKAGTIANALRVRWHALFAKTIK